MRVTSLGFRTDLALRMGEGGRYGREVLEADTFVIVADPADVAIRVYRSCGFADAQRQFSFERPA